jgi:hypothetical protein
MENLRRLVTETQIKELNATINEMYKNKATKLDALGFEELGSYSEDGLHSLIMLVNNLTESEFAKEILLEVLTAAQLKSVEIEISGNIEYYIKELGDGENGLQRN